VRGYRFEKQKQRVSLSSGFCNLGFHHFEQKKKARNPPTKERHAQAR